ncbi:hypothetical protein chiPu_0033719, partial [Chiloscyllium punctatum]|nr:hypothetical protein [Chiloscyllium punctatum]
SRELVEDVGELVLININCGGGAAADEKKIRAGFENSRMVHGSEAVFGTIVARTTKWKNRTVEL